MVTDLANFTELNRILKVVRSAKVSDRVISPEDSEINFFKLNQ